MNEIFSEMLKMSEDLILNVRCRLPRNGAILAENDFVILKAISEDQKDNIMKCLMNVLLLNVNLKTKYIETTYGNHL